MSWRQDFYWIREPLSKILGHLGCCDLCGENVGQSYLSGYSLSQTLLCQYCVNDLPHFTYKAAQYITTGNLLSWPAINRTLPNIHFDRLFSLAAYDYPYDQWLTQLKYSGRFEIAQLFSALLSAKWQFLAKNNNISQVNSSEIDLVLAVPLHIKKWQTRGYNQADLIAKSFADNLALPYDNALVIRTKHNDSQMGKTGAQRRKNLRNAFSLNKDIPKHVKHVLLVDDVVTTGTTASEISKALKQKGVETITLLTVCVALK